MFKKSLTFEKTKNHLQTVRKFRLLDNLAIALPFPAEVPLLQKVTQLSSVRYGRNPTYGTSLAPFVGDFYFSYLVKLLVKEPLADNGFGNLWFGCLVTILGGDWNKIYCRGHIIDFSLDTDVLPFDTEQLGQKSRKSSCLFRSFTLHLKSFTMRKNQDG